MTDHSPDRFDDLLRDAAATYNRPPEERDIPLDAMWHAVAAASFGAPRLVGDASPRSVRRRFTTLARRPGFGIAAALVIGVALGRLSFGVGGRDHALTSSAVADRPAGGARAGTANDPADRDAGPLDPATSRYFGQAAALLIALPSETGGGAHRADERFLMRANDLLLTTRLLLDSPNASDPGVRSLLEDLELVLVQVVRLADERDRGRRTELELIQQALDQRDVLPRLRSAVSEHGAAD